MLSNNDVFIEESQKVTGNLEKWHCNPKDFQKREGVGVVLLREEKAFSEERSFTSRTKLCCFLECCLLVSLSSWYQFKFLGRC